MLQNDLCGPLLIRIKVDKRLVVVWLPGGLIQHSEAGPGADPIHPRLSFASLLGIGWNRLPWDLAGFRRA